MNPRTNHNNWIDLLRGIAALVVTVHHFNCYIPSGPHLWLWIWSKGSLGVPVFFVLSGWCITRSWERSPRSRNFAWRRARRILPAYYASILLVVFLIIGVKLCAGTNDIFPLPKTAGAWLAILTITTKPVTEVVTLNWVYWTLSYELFFYALLSLILLASKIQVRIWTLAGLHFVLCACSFFDLPISRGPFFFIGLWPLFGLGAGLALWEKFPRPALWMILTSIVHSLFAGSIAPDYLVTSWMTFGTLLFAERLPFPSWLQPLRSVGDYSYSLYLTHVPVGVYGILRLFPYPPTSATELILSQCIALVGVLVFARIFYHFFERPFLTASQSSDSQKPAPAISPSGKASIADREV